MKRRCITAVESSLTHAASRLVAGRDNSWYAYSPHVRRRCCTRPEGPPCSILRKQVSADIPLMPRAASRRRSRMSSRMLRVGGELNMRAESRHAKGDPILANAVLYSESSETPNCGGTVSALRIFVACLVTASVPYTASVAQSVATTAQSSPLPAGSAWIGTVRCGGERWDAAIRVDPRDSSLAELSVIVDQQTKTVRSRITARGSSGSFDVAPVDPVNASGPFAMASGTVRTSGDGMERPIISWRPVDGPYPKCIIGMRSNNGGSAELTPSAVQGTVKVFGITINGPLEVPTCKVATQQVRRCTPSGLQCWNEPVRVQEQLPVCFVADKSHIQFSKEEQPKWARGPIGVRLDRNSRVVYIEFAAASGSDVLGQLHATFGSPSQTDSRTRSQDALASCIMISGVVDCKQVQRAGEWTEYTQVWRTSSMEARFDEGSNRAMVRSLISQ